MPYKLRKAPNKPLYWVITIETGKKHSKLPIPMEKAKAQLRILEGLTGNGKVYLQKIRELRRDKQEIEPKLKREHAKMLEHAIKKDLEMFDVLDLPIADKYKQFLQEKKRIDDQIAYWSSIERKEQNDSIPEEDEDEGEGGAKREKSKNKPFRKESAQRTNFRLKQFEKADQGLPQKSLRQLMNEHAAGNFALNPEAMVGNFFQPQAQAAPPPQPQAQPQPQPQPGPQWYDGPQETLFMPPSGRGRRCEKCGLSR